MNTPHIAHIGLYEATGTGYTKAIFYSLSISCPITGITLTRFVITVRAQKLIRPHGKTYPQNATPIITSIITIPASYVLYEPWCIVKPHDRPSIRGVPLIRDILYLDDPCIE